MDKTVTDCGVTLLDFDRRFGLYPHPGPARQGLVGLVPQNARPVDLHRMTVRVGLVRLYREDWITLAGLGVPADRMLVDVDDMLHGVQAYRYC